MCSCRASIAATTWVPSSVAISGAARAASVESPTAGLPAASAMPRAAEIPTRSPVKLPGPVVTAIRSSWANSTPAPLITRAMSGISVSAWPRVMARLSLAVIPPPGSSTAAEQASSAVSMARTRMTYLRAAIQGRGRRSLGTAHDRRTGHEVFHDRAENCRLELVPFSGALGDCDEIRAVKHAGDSRNAKQALGQRRLGGRLLVAYIERTARQYRAS